MSQVVIMSYDFDPRTRAHRRALLLLFNSSSHVRIFASPWTAAQQAPLSSTISPSLLKLMSIESVMLSSHLIFCLLLSLLPSIFPSIRVFSSKSALRVKWPKYWSFGFSISPSSEVNDACVCIAIRMCSDTSVQASRH